MIDTHAHLDALDEPEAALDRARAAGVDRVVTIGTGIDSCRRALELAARDGVYAALGVDPHRAATPDADRLEELGALLRSRPGVVAVGETGLDYHHGADRKAEQRRLFAAQLDLAAAARLPVVVHTRAANDDTLALLRDHPGTVVMHCFSEPGLVDAALEHGWYVSFAETDSPFLSPQPVRGRPNEPANVVHTLAALAEVRGVPAAELEAQIDANASAAFRLP